ncbi:hypothetical protein [Terracoccus luteus]|uniref:Uncharacterized protein n=1 Tax=Terracoccus luteus TaxID=53356 RepID=A0A839Q0F9_9MICO|nr:hypothetical protein [Terracoccus luteus]MBB2988444.1 hypothetical protein [Terracoccus luteus]MCP2174101.1 hypothetical protein [Terracoccus luteus]
MFPAPYTRGLTRSSSVLARVWPFGRGLLAVLAAIVAAAPTPPAAHPPARVQPRALWVWSFDDPRATVDFARRHGVTQMFVAVPTRVTTAPTLPKLRDLAVRAKAAGMRLDALGGDPAWIDNPDWVVTNWVRPVLATGLFTGVHVDMEPYTTPAWDTARTGTVTRYLQTLDRLRVAAGAAPVEADIPFWFWQVRTDTGLTLDQEVMKRTAGVTVMAYRNTAAGPDGTLEVAAAELAHARALGKPVRIGQETNDLGTSASEVKQTFFGKSEQAVNDQLAQVDAGARRFSRYVGIAIHDYMGYAALGR